MGVKAPGRRVVVGAGGLVGARLLAQAAKAGAAVGASLSGRNGLIRLDLAAPETLAALAFDSADTVVLAAAISSPDRCEREFDYCRRVNVVGSGLLIERALAEGARVVFLSSDVVYGETQTPVAEDAALNPSGAYARMKAEIEARFYGHPRFKSVRLSYVFAAEDKFTAYLVACAKAAKPAEVFDPLVRSVVHLDDVVEGLIGLTDRWEQFTGATFNFGGPAAVSRVQIATIVKRVAFAQLQIEVVTPGAEFYRDRPRTIHLISRHLPSILGRGPRAIEAAVRCEFNREGAYVGERSDNGNHRDGRLPSGRFPA